MKRQELFIVGGSMAWDGAKDKGSSGKAGKGGGRRNRIIAIIIIAGVYVLGRMEGEGRFTWSDVISDAASHVGDFATAAADSAKKAVGM